ncbi:hypothetical protein JL721_1487 [Aureococcus anophagefferens]|nr:hypothetical protein JL721_1487 [Aureococcus anophagefferens]
MAKDKASTRKPRRRNARARDDGGTRRATEATPPVRASKRLSVQVSAAASAFLVNFRLRLDAIASIFVNYHEEREALVEKTEAADLIEQNVAELMQLCYRGASAGVGTEWKDDASAEGEGRSRKHLTSQIADEGGPATHQLVAATVIRTGPRRARARDRHGTAARRGAASPAQLLIQFVVLPRKMGTGRDSLEVRDPPQAPRAAPRGGSDDARVPAQTDENVVTCFIDGAATLKRARKQGLLRPVAPRPLNARRVDVVASERLRSLQFDFVLMLCRRLGVKDVFLFATEAGAPAWLTLGFEHVGSSASLIHLRFDLLFKRDRGVLARSARGPETSRLAAARWTARSRSSATPRASTPWSAVQERVAEYGEKQVVRLAKEAANAAAEAGRRRRRAGLDGRAGARLARGAVAAARVVGPGAGGAVAAGARPHRGRAARAAAAEPRDRRGGDSDEGWEESDEDDPVEDLIHRERIRERDLLRTPGCLALGRKAFRLEDMPRATAASSRSARVALSELGDTMTTEAIRARFDLRRDDGVFLCVFARLQRLFPNHNFRLSWSVRFNVVVQTIDAIALDSNLELTRVDMEVRRSTVGVYEDSLACQLLGQTYYVHPDKTIKITVDLVVTSEVIGAFTRPRRPSFRALARSFPLAGTAPGRAEVHIKELGFHFIDPLAPIAEKEIVPRVRVFIPYLGIEGWISITLDDGHLIVELKYLQAMHVKNRMLKKCCYTLYLLELADRLRGEASRETLKTARKNVVEFDMVVLARPTLMRVIRKFANAIARKAAEARGETFVPTPYDETAVDAVVVTAVPPVAPVVAPEPAPPAVSAPAGPPLKALEAMTRKELSAELDAAGVPKAGRAVKHTAIEVLRDLVRRLRAGEPAASLKATLVADGAKKVVFQYGRPGNGTDYLVARWRGLAETDPLRLEFDELARRDVAAAAADEPPVDRLQRAPDPGLVNLPTIWPRMRFSFRVATLGRQEMKAFSCVQVDVNDMETLRARARMCYRVIRDAKRRSCGSVPPRAEDDQCPAYYGVDYVVSNGKPVCKFTVHEGTKTLAKKNAPADRRRSREALRSLENAFSEFMPERFYGIDDRGCAKGKVRALASIPGSGNGANGGTIVFGVYDSKVEVSIQEKNRISEVVVARQEVNVARAEAEKPLPPLHVAGASRRLERYKADFALQLKDLAYVEAADEAYLRDQAAALAPPEPMPDGSRPPIDAHSRRVARGLANTFGA